MAGVKGLSERADLHIMRDMAKERWLKGLALRGSGSLALSGSEIDKSSFDAKSWLAA